MEFDLSHLTIIQVMTLTAIITLIDVVGAMILAATKGEFSLAYVGQWLTSHTVKRVFPIFALAWLGHGVPQIDIPAIPALFGMGVAGLAGYLGETIKSVITNFGTTPPATQADETPVPPA